MSPALPPRLPSSRAYRNALILAVLAPAFSWVGARMGIPKVGMTLGLVAALWMALIFIGRICPGSGTSPKAAKPRPEA